MTTTPVRPEAEVALAPSAAERRATARRWRVVLVLSVLLLAGAAVLTLAGIRGDLAFVLELRGRRLAALVVAGVAVGVSTVLFQTVTANRILTPGIMGFDNLYVLVQTVAVAYLGATAVVTADVRVRFAVEVVVLMGFALLLHALVMRRAAGRGDVLVLVLVGVVLGSMFTSATLLASRVIDPNDALTLQDLLFASFGSPDRQLLPVAAAVVAAGTVLALRRAAVLDVIALGREPAVGLGVDHAREMRRAFLLVAVLVAVSTALVGPLTFLGLLAANVARELLATHRHRWTLPTACLVAVLALVLAQLVLERLLGWGTAVAVVIDVVGGLYLLLLLVRQGRPTSRGTLL
ncbi:iron chelate uptake ABC transporter family permease subunit [Pseudokineococcus sp. 1T1Z-3]|uniref:iron chelate uptake ABC transporter family permease subunit n=1 Tax=Pseudokineococcus sp. 1T1Z-3 TaxID=3132745 RepID=UPI0030AE029A